jgi:hypothetical protein
MAYYDELKFAGIVNEQARKIVAALVSGRVDLAQQRAFDLCTFAANRHSTLLLTEDCRHADRYDLAALGLEVGGTYSESEPDLK